MHVVIGLLRQLVIITSLILSFADTCAIFGQIFDVHPRHGVQRLLDEALLGREVVKPRAPLVRLRRRHDHDSAPPVGWLEPLGRDRQRLVRS